MSSERVAVLRLHECVSECLSEIAKSTDKQPDTSCVPDDIVAAIRIAGRAILMVESMEDLARVAKERMRRTLADVMDENGIPNISIDTHIISSYQGAPHVVIMNDAAIPDTYYVQPPAKLSRELVIRALKAGTDIPGATLSNGGPVLRIAQRKK